MSKQYKRSAIGNVMVEEYNAKRLAAGTPPMPEPRPAPMPVQEIVLWTPIASVKFALMAAVRGFEVLWRAPSRIE